MSKPRRPRRFKKRHLLAAGCLGVAIAFLLHSSPNPSPDAIFVLGGEPQREQFAALFAQQHPSLPVWVSGGSNPEYAEWVFDEAGIDRHRVHLDYDAVDTVTNFTTIVDKLAASNIDSLYLLTSADHMRRAEIIGNIIFRSRNIQFKAVPIPSDRPNEPLSLTLCDGVRALYWVVTGDDSLSLKQRLSASRHARLTLTP